jgi:enoyl-CoA hydratase/carnithine racemase
MRFKTISWKTEDEIGHLVLNQPPANTMTRLFFDELEMLVRAIIPCSGMKALVVYGAGRHFSAGADHYDLTRRIMESLPESYPEEIPSFLESTMRSFLYIDQLNVPTIAAIRGTCFGSALELALACKFRICAEGTVLGFPESSFGLMPGCGGSVRLAGIVGRPKAIELILSGRNFSAEEAYSWGLVHRILPRKTVVDETLKIAGRMILKQIIKPTGKSVG